MKPIRLGLFLGAALLLVACGTTTESPSPVTPDAASRTDSEADARRTPAPGDTGPAIPTEDTRGAGLPDTTPPTEPDVRSPDCQTHEQFFQQKVWAPLMSTVCIGCHSASGIAKETKLTLQSEGWPGWLAANMERVAEVAAYEYEGTSILLLKPSGQIAHEGGALVSVDSEAYLHLEELVARLKTPDDCEPVPVEDVGAFAGVILLNANDTFRKASLQLAGRVPTTEESAYLEVNGWGGVSVLLDDLMTEEAFYERLKEGFNDQFLTDRYDRGEDGLNLLNTTDYPDRKWFEDEDYEASVAVKSLGDQHTNSAVARAPLELIAWVVREERPFTEILTADYTVVNAFSARTFGVYDAIDWVQPLDWSEQHAVSIPGIPHAGILTEPMFLNRFPTTDTNRNRHRSRKVWDFFLATDVLALAEQPIDPTTIEDHNPTLFNPNCTVCHEIIDPVAGAFQNWNEGGRYLPPEGGWYPDMVAPGFADEQIPFNGHGTSLQWLAAAIAEDQRFAIATVQTVFEMLTGQPALRPPSMLDGSIQTPEELAARTVAYDAQSALLEGVATEFTAENYDFKSVVKNVVLSPYFRAAGLSEAPTEQRALELHAVGTARLLTPEALNRKIVSTTGFPWRPSAWQLDFLLDVNQYRIFYGGIDSNQVVDRIQAPSGVMAAVQARMANELACKATPHDLAHLPWERRLLPYVESSFQPQDDNGFAVPQAEQAIRDNVRHLHRHLLGESDPAPEELELTYQLWFDVWSAGKAAVAAGDEGSNLHWACQAKADFLTSIPYPESQQVTSDPNFTVRAWTAVVAYLLSDYRFLYE